VRLRRSTNEVFSVSESSDEQAPGPQARTHLDGRKQPEGLALVADERAELISLKLHDVEIS
jgi:hypothetical protein|tara:strand:- start:143 stop:325 length:183 start_codon:yes stop_codon:yes gene_type:complete